MINEDNNNKETQPSSPTLTINTPVPIEMLVGAKAVMTQEQHDRLLKDMNIPKIIEDNKEKLEAAMMVSIANDRAALEPLPDVVNDIFDLDHNLIVNLENGAAVKIRKMVALDLTIFKLTESPFYKLMMGDVEDKSGDPMKTLFPNEELFFSLVYQFVNDVKQVYREVKKDKQLFHDAAVEEIGALYSTPELLKLVEAIFRYIEKVNGARINVIASETVADNEENKKKQ